MTILAYFIAGYAAINLIDSLISLLCTALEVPKAKLSLKITEYNSKISKIAEEEIRQYEKEQQKTGAKKS